MFAQKLNTVLSKYTAEGIKSTFNKISTEMQIIADELYNHKEINTEIKKTILKVNSELLGVDPTPLYMPLRIKIFGSIKRAIDSLSLEIKFGVLIPGIIVLFNFLSLTYFPSQLPLSTRLTITVMVILGLLSFYGTLRKK